MNPQSPLPNGPRSLRAQCRSRSVDLAEYRHNENIWAASIRQGLVNKNYLQLLHKSYTELCELRHLERLRRAWCPRRPPNWSRMSATDVRGYITSNPWIGSKYSVFRYLGESLE